MTRYEATYDISSRADERAVRRLMERTYDTLREELREVDDSESDRKAVLQAFQTLRDAARDPSPGTLTVVYETADSEDGKGDETTAN